MTTYFDAVLNEDMTPVFNGTTDDTVEWLVATAGRWGTDYHYTQVRIGKTMKLVPFEDYLDMFDEGVLT